MKAFCTIVFYFLFAICNAQPLTCHHLQYTIMPDKWYEAIPLGNGMLGALIYQKKENLRIALDRADLWDDRPMPLIDQLRFKWVLENVKKNNYDTVQKIGDAPYENNAAPTKIPCAALQFDCSKIGKATAATLDISNGLSTIQFEKGIVFKTYIHASNLTGYFTWEGLQNQNIPEPELNIPGYFNEITGNAGNSVTGQGVERLGYEKGHLSKTKQSIIYHQPTWKGSYYEVMVQWQRLKNNTIIGQWTVSKNKKAILSNIDTTAVEPTFWDTHIQWWQNYWEQSSVQLPDTILEKQYYMDMYKFACVARDHTPPISLQAIWTADNGNLPPWKGDFHHDLNTQLSYWPGYTGNHTSLTKGFTNWLWKVKSENKKWTKQYFERNGLNVPGVSTISGKPMGGWIQYSMSTTTGAWLAQYFYWQWKFTMDKRFFKHRLKPYFNGINRFVKTLVVTKNSDPENILSSAPEYNDNNITAWFRDFTNYDLALIRNALKMHKEILSINKIKSRKVKKIENLIGSLQNYDQNQTGLSIAPMQNLETSHRHHSHLMAIYPVAELDFNKDTDTALMMRSFRHLCKLGTRNWTGYSFSWAGCIAARLKQADSAVRFLKIFATNFVASNSFHLNGDQHGGIYSDYIYNPFTLEGNFAYAQGIHELLLQNKNGYVEVFPAVPKSWNNVSFKDLRAYGGFLISSKKENGIYTSVTIKATVKGVIKIKLPFRTFIVKEKKAPYPINNGIVIFNLKKGEQLQLENGFE